MALNKGDKAPEFKLFNTEKKEVALEDFKGRNLIVMFFPLAFTSVCTAQLCTARDSMSDYQALNAEVVGVSVDSLFTLAKFKEEQKLQYHLLSDFNKEVSQAFGAIYDEFAFGMKGVSKRAAFVVGPDGKIKYAEVLESAGDHPNYEEVKKALEA